MPHCQLFHVCYLDLGECVIIMNVCKVWGVILNLGVGQILIVV